MPKPQKPPHRVLALVTEAFGGRGGIAEYNRNFLRALTEAPGAEVRVLTRLLPVDAVTPPVGLAQRTAPGGKLGFSWQTLVSAIQWRPDLLFCGHLNLLPPCAFIGRLLRIPVWLQIHGIDAWSPLSGLHRLGFRGVSQVLSVSHFTSRRLLEWAPVPPERVKLIPNTYDAETFRPGPYPTELARRLGLEGHPVVLCVGRLNARERYKGQDRIIRLMPRLLEARPDLLFVIAGDGDDRTRLEQLAASQGVADAVRFLGYVPHDQLPDLFRLADLFVLAGHGEGFGIVLLEAMACGVPVLASSRDGSREAVGNGALGVVVDPEDETGFIAAILSGLQAVAPPRERLEAHFGYPIFRARVHSLLDTDGERASS